MTKEIPELNIYIEIQYGIFFHEICSICAKIVERAGEEEIAQ